MYLQVESVSKETDGETEGNDSEDVEIPQTLTVNDCKVTIKVKEEPDKIKDKENKPGSKYSPNILYLWKY